ncbi:MAG: hypothetical protein K6T92_03630 [Candidatus Rokubacteria bacterium]|nr:hypothetical protein [Candidatus Rokubacteria bacterium]
MKKLPFLLVAWFVGSGLADAAPGDPVALRGTLAWPPALAAEPFVVVRADDGRFYYVDVARADRRGGQGLRAGERLSLLGVEGSRPWEIGAVAVAAGDAALVVPPAPSEPAASPPTEGVATAPPRRAEPRPWERIDGTIQSVSGRTVVVRRADGRTVRVDVARLALNRSRDLAPGTRVTLFTVVEEGGQPTAVGLVRSDTGR